MRINNKTGGYAYKRIVIIQIKIEKERSYFDRFTADDVVLLAFPEFFYLLVDFLVIVLIEEELFFNFGLLFLEEREGFKEIFIFNKMSKIKVVLDKLLVKAYKVVTYLIKEEVR